MSSFALIYDQALERVGCEQALHNELPVVTEPEQLYAVPDQQILSFITRCVFRAGFAWKVIDKKWDGFEAVFQQFDIEFNASLTDEDLERFANDERIIRNLSKIKTVRTNARFIEDCQQQHGSFAKLIAEWPTDNITGLWLYLKEGGARLGGKTGQYLLRELGKDTFMLTKDVMDCLIQYDVVPDDNSTSRERLRAVQHQFNQWHEDTGLAYSALSKICALSQ